MRSGGGAEGDREKMQGDKKNTLPTTESHSHTGIARECDDGCKWKYPGHEVEEWEKIGTGVREAYE